MNVNEFRLGNKIMKFGIDYVGENPVVDRSDFEVIDVTIDVLKNINDFNGSIDYYYCEPVILTEEWFLKFNFQKIGRNFRIWHDYGNGSREFIVYYNSDSKKYELKASNYLYELKYVHQLQNIYLDLSLCELQFIENSTKP